MLPLAQRESIQRDNDDITFASSICVCLTKYTLYVYERRTCGTPLALVRSKPSAHHYSRGTYGSCTAECSPLRQNRLRVQTYPTPTIPWCYCRALVMTVPTCQLIALYPSTESRRRAPHTTNRTLGKSPQSIPHYIPWPAKTVLTSTYCRYVFRHYLTSRAEASPSSANTLRASLAGRPSLKMLISCNNAKSIQVSEGRHACMGTGTGGQILFVTAI